MRKMFGMEAAECKKIIDGWISDGSLGERLPEVAELRGVPQSHLYHGEGDAYIHTMLAVDALEDDADHRVFWAVLLHDIGKSVTTVYIDGRWCSRGHEVAGARLVPEIMSRLGMAELADDVAWLVRHHDFVLSWNLKSGCSLTARQRRFMGHPLFPYLLRVVAADAAASWGISDKGEMGRMLGNMMADL